MDMLGDLRQIKRLQDFLIPCLHKVFQKLSNVRNKSHDLAFALLTFLFHFFPSNPTVHAWKYAFLRYIVSSLRG